MELLAMENNLQLPDAPSQIPRENSTLKEKIRRRKSLTHKWLIMQVKNKIRLILQVNQSIQIEMQK